MFIRIKAVLIPSIMIGLITIMILRIFVYGAAFVFGLGDPALVILSGNH